MTIFDDIRKEREAGTPGPWRSEASDGPVGDYGKAGCGVWSEYIFEAGLEGMDNEDDAMDDAWVCGIWGGIDLKKESDSRRIARVPQLEAIALAAEELKEAIDYCDNHGVVPADICDALDKLEEACK